MIITYNGDNYFKLQSGDKSILIDPTDKRSFKGSNLIINTVRPAVTEPEDDIFWIDHQGEYEVEGIFVKGWQSDWDGEVEKTIYRVDFEEIKFAILGQLTKNPKPESLEGLDNIDIMIIPGGGEPYIEEGLASKVARQVEPALIIPSLFKKEPDVFLKELGKSNYEMEEKIVLKKKDLRQGTMEIRCLKS
ncbi:MAG: MBL fold metallo-hydrolase [Candidatus Paceibacterota bacterium]